MVSIKYAITAINCGVRAADGGNFPIIRKKPAVLRR